MRSPAADVTLNADLLSDTKGTNLDAYMRSLLAEIKAHWTPVAAAQRERPLEQQKTDVRCTIAPDGTLLAMRLEHASDNAPLDKAAWNATRDAVYGPLPTGLRDAKLEVRVHFLLR